MKLSKTNNRCSFYMSLIFCKSLTCLIFVSIWHYCNGTKWTFTHIIRNGERLNQKMGRCIPLPCSISESVEQLSRKGKNEGTREKKRVSEVFKVRCFKDRSVFNYSVHAVIYETRPCNIEKVSVRLQTPSMRGQRSRITPPTYRWTYITPLQLLFSPGAEKFIKALISHAQSKVIIRRMDINVKGWNLVN